MVRLVASNLTYRGGQMIKLSLRPLNVFIALATLVLAFTACNSLKSVWNSGVSGLSLEHAAVAIVSVPPTIHAGPCSSVPVRIGLAQDQSMSTRETRVEPATIGQMKPLVDLITCSEGHGGAVALTVIRDGRDNTSLTRLQVDAPPTHPVPLDEVMESRKNPLDADEDRNAYQQIFDQYGWELESWRGETQQRVEAFEKSAAPLLDHPANAQRSRVCDAVRRLDLFSSEPEAGNEAPDRILILQTDGLSTERQGDCGPLTTQAIVLLVNGSGSVGELRKLKLARFTTLDAAIDFVLRKEKR